MRGSEVFLFSAFRLFTEDQSPRLTFFMIAAVILNHFVNLEGKEQLVGDVLV